jgi:cell wall assembly regulator SMI1
MDWSELEWRIKQPRATDEQLQRAEGAAGVRFPPDYRACIVVVHGGAPLKARFSFDDPRIGRMGSSIGLMLSLAEDDGEGLVAILAALREQLPAKVVPFAIDAGGDCMCFDYRAVGPAGSPTVVYWHHEREGEDALSPLAGSFSQFLGMLTGRDSTTP